MTIKEPSSILSLSDCSQLQTTRKRYPVIPHHSEKPLAPGHPMLHKKDYCSSGGTLKLPTYFALLLFYSTSLGNSSAGQSAGLQSNWGNFSLPIYLSIPTFCEWRRKGAIRQKKK